MKDYYEIGQRISEMRKERHITQEKLAEILDISVKHCSEVERGLSSLSLDKLIFLSDYFDCTLDYMLRGKEIMPGIKEFPKELLSILESSDNDEKEILLDYLKLFVKIHKSYLNKGNNTEK